MLATTMLATVSLARALARCGPPSVSTALACQNFQPAAAAAAAALTRGFAVGAGLPHGALSAPRGRLGPAALSPAPAALLCSPGPHHQQVRRLGDAVHKLREYNRKGRHMKVVRLFESGQVEATASALKEYISALVKTDRLDGSTLLNTIMSGMTNRAQAQGATSGSGVSAQRLQALEDLVDRLRDAGGDAGPGLRSKSLPKGTAEDPLVVRTQVQQPSFLFQALRTLFWICGLLIAWAWVGAMFEKNEGRMSGVFPGASALSGVGGEGVKPATKTDTKFDDVKGVDEAKHELVEVVEYLKNPERFTRLGGKLPKGLLLVGPPGTGKTMLARAIAGEAGVPFFYASGSEFEEMFVGVGARRVRDLFKAAKKASPCIVFIDEIDAVGGKRSPRDNQLTKMTLNQMLIEMDGFKQNVGVIVIGATNFPQSLDKALVRPGRFDRTVVVPSPDVEGRRQILESHFKNVPKGADVDLSVIARGTPGFSGADLANLVNLAALNAAVQQCTAVSMAALEYAKDRIMMGTERKSAVISEENRRLTAYHEGGHALVALFTDGAHPVHKATIVPRGQSLGMVMQLPEKDQTSISRKQLLARLDVCMGGRVAEELIFGPADVTTGASSDLQQATNLARAMVTKYGMSKRVGNLQYDLEEREGAGSGLAISDETKKAIEEEVRSLVESAYGRAKALLKAHEKDLHTIAKSLLEKETLTGDQIRTMFAEAIARSQARRGSSVASV